MNQRIYCWSLILGTFYLLTSCSKLILGVYGMEDPQVMDDENIIQLARSYNLPESDLYKIDSSYSNYIHDLDSSYDQSLVQNHLQPLQALYFNNSGELISYQVNCYAGGLPNLKWNRNDNMESFPPKQQAPLDNIIPYYKHIELLRKLPKSKEFSLADFDYVVMVYWSQMMGRQNEHFFETIQENCALIKDSKVKIVYVNNDQMFKDSY